MLPRITTHRPPKKVVDGFTRITANHPQPVLFLLGLSTRMVSHHRASVSIYSHHREFFCSVETRPMTQLLLPKSLLLWCDLRKPITWCKISNLSFWNHMRVSSPWEPCHVHCRKSEPLSIVKSQSDHGQSIFQSEELDLARWAFGPASVYSVLCTVRRYAPQV